MYVNIYVFWIAPLFWKSLLKQFWNHPFCEVTTPQPPPFQPDVHPMTLKRLCFYGTYNQPSISNRRLNVLFLWRSRHLCCGINSCVKPLHWRLGGLKDIMKMISFDAMKTKYCNSNSNNVTRVTLKAILESCFCFFHVNWTFYAQTVIIDKRSCIVAYLILVVKSFLFVHLTR